MRLAHVALWTTDLEAASRFWRDYFNAEIGPLYRSANRPGFSSRFVRLPGGGPDIEVMSGPWIDGEGDVERQGWDHVAVRLGDAAAVDTLAVRCSADGILRSGPRQTGDGFYEAVIAMPDGTRVEITA